MMYIRFRVVNSCSTFNASIKIITSDMLLKPSFLFGRML